MMEVRRLTRLLAITLIVLCGELQARELLWVEVTQPYVDMRTGPGRAYPVFYVAERGEILRVLKRKTQWYKVVLSTGAERQKTGWVHHQQLADTLVYTGPGSTTDTHAATASGSPAQRAGSDPRLAYLFNPRWSGGFALGNFGGADLVSAHLNYRLTENYSVQLQGSEYLGSTEEGWIAGLKLCYEFYPKWYLSPALHLGAGYINQSFKGSAIEREDNEDALFDIGLSLSLRISQRYRLRFEYSHMNVLTSTNDNQEIESWQLGFNARF